MAESGVEITRGSPERCSFSSALYCTPSAPSRSSTAARNGAEFSPMPAVNTIACAPSTATWYPPTYLARR